MNSNEDLRWAEGHAIAFALGALDEEEEPRFRSILSGEDDWADLFGPGDEDDLGHVPAALLARWEAAGRQLRGIERELVLNHVFACASCREDLQLLGLSPALWSTRVEGNGRTGWLPWIGGAVLGAAAAMILFMGVPRDEAPFVHGVELQVATPSSMRGAGPAPVVVSPDATAIIMATALPSDIAAGTTPLLVVIDPEGRRMSETRLDAAPWSPPSTQIVLVTESGFVAGDYSVMLEETGEADSRSLGSFRIEHSR